MHSGIRAIPSTACKNAKSGNLFDTRQFGRFHTTSIFKLSADVKYTESVLSRNDLGFHSL